MAALDEAVAARNELHLSDAWRLYRNKPGTHTYLCGQHLDACIAALQPAPPPPGFTESPDNTVVNDTAGKIVDANGHVWQITAAGKVSVDGAADAVTSGVVELAYESKKVWQKNSAGRWWYKLAPADTWLPSGGTTTSPVPGDTPPPPPPPPPPPSGSSFDTFVGVVGADPVLVGQKGVHNDRIDIGFLTKAKVDAASNVQITPIACYNPWSDLRPSGTGDHYAPETAAHRDEWSRRMMTKIQGVFTTPPKAIEPWNEPWLQGFWNAGPNPADFLDLCRRFAAVCWATPGYEQTLILVSADSGWGGWCDKLIAADTAGFLKNPLVRPTAHPYCNNQAPAATATKDYGFQRYQFTYDAFKAHGHPDPKVWLTEFGWVTNTPGSSPIGSEGPAVSEAQQAQYHVDAYTIAKASGKVEKAFSYMLSPNQAWSYNWLRPDNTDKPVVAAVKALTAS